MFVKVSKNKENFEDKRLKKAPSYEVDDVFKGREFGKELTNNTESTSDSVVDDKTNYSTEEMIYESSVPHMTSKTHKLSDHNNDSSRVKFIKISEKEPTTNRYKCGKDLKALEGEELTKALQEELRLRRKEITKNQDDHSNYDDLLMQCSQIDNSNKNVVNLKSPEYVAEYVVQCIKWMKSQEEVYKIKHNYMEYQEQKKPTHRKKISPYKITREDRAQAIDTVVEIHRKYGLVPETLFVTVSTIDRYISSKKEEVKRGRDIEAIAVASLLLSSKYEDIYPPALDEMIKFMRKSCTRKEILEWEFKILKELVFQITVPTPFRFLERFASASSIFLNALPLAQYVIELALYDFDIQYNLRPSEIAAVALFISANFEYHNNKIADKRRWSSVIAKESCLKKAKIIELFNTYFLDLAFRIEKEYKVNDISIKYPQFQFIDSEPFGLFNPV